MTNPLDAAHYADRACRLRVRVRENVQIARDTFRLRFDCPSVAARIVPGQFVMLRLADCDDPLLGRPLALYDTVLADGDRGDPVGIDLVYLVLGKMTRRLARLRPGAELEIWGPLGNGFPPQSTEHLVMVAGGIGQTPFPALAREHLGLRRYGEPPRKAAKVARVTLCYGARSKDYLAGLDDFSRIGVDVQTSTDDGTAGHHGLVTELLARVLGQAPNLRVVCCGPEPMMEAVARLTAARGIACQVSLETPMACGIGICFSCVARVRDASGGWDYRRTCVEGPVFDAAQIAW
jgi:dihydroorotate dehydrogenase electron transfer subunit